MTQTCGKLQLLQPPSPTLDVSSPQFPPFSLPCPIKCDHNPISAAEKELLDEVKVRLVSSLHLRSTERTPSIISSQEVLSKSSCPSHQQCSAMLRDALERKKMAVLLLASAQSDIEKHSSWMIEEEGLNETICFNCAHYNIRDHQTAIGKFIKAMSSITVNKACSSVDNQGPVCCPIYKMFVVPCIDSNCYDLHSPRILRLLHEL